MPAISATSRHAETDHAADRAFAPFFIARQPIFDAARDVVAYELLFRTGAQNAIAVGDGNQATARTLVHAIMDFGLDALVGDKPAFVNLTRHFLVEQDAMPAMQQRLVLEVLEDVTPDAEVIDSLRRLVDKGYTLALDDFTYREELRPLVELAHVVKLELPAIGLAALPAHVDKLRTHGCLLLAEKVETYEDFEACRALGIDYFQGYFLSRPEMLSSKRLPSNQLAVLQVLAKVQNPDTPLAELERLISTDVGLAYRIMRFASSARFAAGGKVDTIRRAIVMTGLQQIRTWASLIVMARLDDKPPELLRLTSQRTRLCELLAREVGQQPAEIYAAAGLFSTLEALLDRPIGNLLSALSLPEHLDAALRRRDGPIGEILDAVIALERGDEAPCARLGIDPQRVGELHLEAMLWADESEALMKQPVPASKPRRAQRPP
jgi:EAL and modified HD-GYP domain-containing signal transduction protein